MPALSDAVVIGTVLTLIFGAVAYYLYSRVVQAETKLGLVESILLNLKMATESTLFSSMNEVAPSPPKAGTQKLAPSGSGSGSEDEDANTIQKMIDEVHATSAASAAAAEEDNSASNDEDKDVDFVPSSNGSSVTHLHVVKDSEGGSKLHIGFESMSWKELCAEGKKRGVTGMSHMNRKKLIDILNKKEGITNVSSISNETSSLSSWTNQAEMIDATDLPSIHEFPEGGSPLSSN